MKKIYIYTFSYPFGLKEAFLHNEVEFLSKHFHIELFPLFKENKDDICRSLPKNVEWNEPFLSDNKFTRFYKGIFNLAPLFPFLKDLVVLFRSGVSFEKIIRWYFSLINSRTILASKEFSEAMKSQNSRMYFYWGNFPIGLLPKSTPKRIIVRVHGGEADLNRNKGYIPLLKLRFVLRKNVMYVPISNNAKDLIKYTSKTKKKVIRIGVKEIDLKGRLPKEDHNYVTVVSCSNLIKLKRVHLIAEALGQLKPSIKVKWFHFGDGPEKSRLEDDVEALDENIKVYLMGHVKNEDLLAWYCVNYVDLFINVSTHEGVPVSIMEAFSFGIPCFATNAGGTSELLNESNGFLVDVNFDSQELAQCIESIKELSEVRKLRFGAKSTFEEKCDANKNFTRILNLFSSN